MRSKKTLQVQPLLETANLTLANPELSKEFKMGVATMIERILHSSGNYEGFQFLRNWKSKDFVEAPSIHDEDYYDRIYWTSRKLETK